MTVQGTDKLFASLDSLQRGTWRMSYCRFAWLNVNITYVAHDSHSSSEYSDWTADAGINLQPSTPVSSRKRVRRQLSSSEEDNEEEEKQQSDEEERPPQTSKQKSKKPKSKMPKVSHCTNLHILFVNACILLSYDKK